ncbi:hypothetical protein EOM39_03995 [Candidatus Gracilibacteria bacterium]|nr:hypothetical protein [Candidatus Gracilibacteria bacterium]
MQLFIHLGTNLEYFKLLNEGFLLSMGKEDRDIANFILENYPGELATNISPQYEVNFVSIREIKRKFGPDAFNKIDGIYYGSDNCEYLVPYKNEVENAIEEFKEFNKKYPPHKVRTFTLVTPYVGDKMLSYLEESLGYLNNLSIKNPIEVVINDFGVLNLVYKKYTNLKPIFGRVIHKLLKTPLIDTYGYEAHPSGELIKNKTEQEKKVLRDEIVKWQLKFYNSAEVSLDIYQNFLKKFRVERVALDYMEKREDLYNNKNQSSIGIDIYYPWALVFTGRLCDTSAIENPSKGFYATDDICPRTCNRYDISYKIKTVGYNLIQRGNAGYRSEVNLDYLSDIDFVKDDNNRLVFAPFVSV